MALARVEGKEETGNVAELLAVLVLAVLRWPDTGARGIAVALAPQKRVTRRFDGIFDGMFVVCLIET